MKTYHITLLRHAIAQDAAPAQDDRERVLNKQGRRRLARVSNGLKSLIDSLELIVASPLVRAQQSAEIVARHFPVAKRISCEALAPGHAPAELHHWLLQQTQQRIMLIGHEPDLSLWAGWLLSGHAKSLFNLTKAGACQLELTNQTRPGNAQLRWLMTSKQLRSLSQY